MLNIAIFIIDDDEGQRLAINALFKANNIVNYTIFSDPEELLKALHEGVQICVLDYNLRHEVYTGLSVMEEIRKRSGACKCIIMSGYEDATLIKEFLNKGAFRYISKGDPNFGKDLIQYVGEAREQMEHDYEFFRSVRESLDNTHRLLVTYRNKHKDDAK